MSGKSCYQPCGVENDRVAHQHEPKMSINKERAQQQIVNLGLSVREVAKRCQTTTTTLANWLDGKKLTAGSLEKLAAALSVTPEWLSGAGSSEPAGRRAPSVQERVTILAKKLAEMNSNKLQQDFLLDYLVKAIEVRVIELS